MWWFILAISIQALAQHEHVKEPVHSLKRDPEDVARITPIVGESQSVLIDPATNSAENFEVITFREYLRRISYGVNKDNLPQSEPMCKFRHKPTAKPTHQPQAMCKMRPISPTPVPTSPPQAMCKMRPVPNYKQSAAPTTAPSDPEPLPGKPTAYPFAAPTTAPSDREPLLGKPTAHPSAAPTTAPSGQEPLPGEPTAAPSAAPTTAPSDQEPLPGEPTAAPSAAPTGTPSDHEPLPGEPTASPSAAPSVAPEESTSEPTVAPSVAPVESTASPTVAPTVAPSMECDEVGNTGRFSILCHILPDGNSTSGNSTDDLPNSQPSSVDPARTSTFVDTSNSTVSGYAAVLILFVAISAVYVTVILGGFSVLYACVFSAFTSPIIAAKRNNAAALSSLRPLSLDATNSV